MRTKYGKRITHKVRAKYDGVILATLVGIINASPRFAQCSWGGSCPGIEYKTLEVRIFTLYCQALLVTLRT